MIDTNIVLDALNYRNSPNYLPVDELRTDPEKGFLFRRAEQECGLVGAYVLRGGSISAEAGRTPIVYLARTEDDERARQIHRQVWNQNLVPFLIVISPNLVRLYPGFRYDTRKGLPHESDQGVLRSLRHFNEVATILGSFRADKIDGGAIWREWAAELTPETRVDRRLLTNLCELEESLLARVHDRALVHAAIGKFVYLRYLWDRGILSQRKLENWNLQESEVFGRKLEIDCFQKLLDNLDAWLNGSVFPISHDQLELLGRHRLGEIAGIFRGDLASGQIAFDFANYDFSFIPIETLSSIYEQFLHSPDPKTGVARGREEGAYYTPVPVVNFMLSQLDKHHPLRPGMRVLDPSCGSGVFLVQCYRRLIEQRILDEGGRSPTPNELRALLTEHIFGMDTDVDACQLAELSLILTLLDYVEPPDLESSSLSGFRLPNLRDENVLQKNAFADSANTEGSFDWVVGNPPWKESHGDESIADWRKGYGRGRPIGGGQIAELFAWRSLDFLRQNGAVSLLLPAMTLFKYESASFRRDFLEEAEVWFVANFANLSGVLFGGRSTIPAAAFFYGKPRTNEPRATHIAVYAPFLANQALLYDPGTRKKQREAWSLMVNVSEMRNVRYRDVLSGNSLPWKLASWGSFLDKQLLESMAERFPTLDDLQKQGSIVVAEGFQLRKRAGSAEKLDYKPELIGKRKLLPTVLKERRHLWRFPASAVAEVAIDEVFVRRRGGYDRPLAICEPPHVIVSASRGFAVYDEQFLIVPPRQIGISASSEKRGLLKALALYLNSDFVLYHQFLTSSQAGVQKTLSTLRELKMLPVPFGAKAEANFQPWIELYDRVAAEKTARDDLPESALREINELTAAGLELDVRARILIHDLVHVRSSLTRGKIDTRATAKPEKHELVGYGAMLRDELDAFLGDVGAHHEVNIYSGNEAGLVEIALSRDRKDNQDVPVSQISGDLLAELGRTRANLRERLGQWFYVERNLRIYQGSTLYISKPMQRMHWTESQAMLDAGDLINDILTFGSKDEPSA